MSIKKFLSINPHSRLKSQIMFALKHFAQKLCYVNASTRPVGVLFYHPNHQYNSRLQGKSDFNRKVRRYKRRFSALFICVPLANFHANDFPLAYEKHVAINVLRASH